MVTETKQISFDDLFDKPIKPNGSRRDYWTGEDQVFMTGGLAFAVAPDGNRFVLGEEAKVIVALQTGKLPENISTKQREEYLRIFELKGESDGSTTTSGKPSRLSLQRERHYGASRSTAKHTRRAAA